MEKASGCPTSEGIVYFPELRSDGRNWKIYREKILEVACIARLTRFLAGTEQKPESNGNEQDNWWRLNSYAHQFVLWNISDSLLLQLPLLVTAHEMFYWLSTRFSDNEPISIPEDPAEPLSGCKDEQKGKNDDAAGNTEVATDCGNQSGSAVAVRANDD